MNRKAILSIIILILIVTMMTGCGQDSKSNVANDRLQYSETLVDDDTLKFELLGYGDSPNEKFDEVIAKIHYKGSLVKDAPFDEIIKSILNDMTGIENSMSLHAELYALDEKKKEALLYEDDYVYNLFWMNSKDFEILKEDKPNNDLNSSDVGESEIKLEESQQTFGSYQIGEVVEIKGFIEKTWQEFPTWCLGMTNSIEVYDDGGANPRTITTNQIFFFDEDKLNGKEFEEYSDGITLYTIRGTLINYRDGGEIFITEPVIVE